MATENIPSRLHSVAQGNVVTGANEILDDDNNKKQNVINNELIVASDLFNKRIGDKSASTGTSGTYPYNGMGRVYLPKNMINGVNTLTQDMFYKGNVGSRVPNTNTIFVIQYDYVLAENITIPENCVLEFDGGSLNNGVLTSYITPEQAHSRFYYGTSIFCGIPRFHNIVYKGGLVGEIYASWFGAKGDGITDDTVALQDMLNFAKYINVPLFKKFILDGSEYLVSSTIIAETSYCEIRGESNGYRLDTSVVIKSNNYSQPVLRCKGVGINLTNLCIGYVDYSLVTENSTAILYKSTDVNPPEGSEGYPYTDTDAAITNCQLLNCYTGIEYWGVQSRIINCGFTSIYKYGIRYKEYATGNRPQGGARMHLAEGCNFHAVEKTAYKFFNDTADGYGFFITNTFDDSFGTFFKGNLINSKIANNKCNSLMYPSSVIESEIIQGTVICNNMFDTKAQEVIENIETPMQRGIKTIELSSSIITNNSFGSVRGSAIVAEKSINVVITNNVFGRTYEEGETDSNNIAFLVSAIIILANAANRGNFKNVIISSNVFNLRTTNSYLVAYDSSGDQIEDIDNKVNFIGGGALPKDNNNIPIKFAYPRNGNVSIVSKNLPYYQSSTVPAIQNRPYDPIKGEYFFDESLNPARPIWYNGTAWVDATGQTV